MCSTMPSRRRSGGICVPPAPETSICANSARRRPIASASARPAKAPRPDGSSPSRMAKGSRAGTTTGAGRTLAGAADALARGGGGMGAACRCAARRPTTLRPAVRRGHEESQQRACNLWCGHAGARQPRDPAGQQARDPATPPALPRHHPGPPASGHAIRPDAPDRAHLQANKTPGPAGRVPRSQDARPR